MFASRPAKGTLGYGKALFCIYEGETASDRLSELLDAGIQQNAFTAHELNSLVETANKLKAAPRIISVLTQRLQQLQENPAPVSTSSGPATNGPTL